MLFTILLKLDGVTMAAFEEAHSDMVSLSSATEGMLLVLPDLLVLPFMLLQIRLLVW
jgi:hypothetical protein